ncbi:MAG TPA: aldo/keto reductase [bacterium]|nr:aldo/keto reductase [bacterium]HPN44318.1 aldo/keto reductase [bacterium]
MIKKITRKEFLQTGAGLAALSIFPGALAQATPQYRVLGRTGLQVTTLGFGATRTNDPSFIRTALDSGINFLDTGRIYANGQNEVVIGNVIKEFRKKIIIQTKVTLELRENGEQLKTRPVAKKIQAMLETSLQESLEALQTDYLDVLLLHNLTSLPLLQHETVRSFFTEAKKSGKIRACGFSSHENQAELLRTNNSDHFYDVVMVAYNHRGSYTHTQTGRFSEWDQQALETELQTAAQNNIGIVAMKTCSGGPLSLSPDKTPSWFDAIQWVLQHSYIASAAVAMANMDELKENSRILF